MILLLLACATGAPSEAPTTPTTSSPTVTTETLTVRVPSDCPHILVDVISGSTSNVTVACFDQYSTRTYFENYQSVPIGVAADRTLQDRLVVEFSSRDKLPVRTTASQ